MKTKLIPISEVKKGMKIKTYDPDTKETVFKEVTDKFDTYVPSQDQVRLEFTNGTVINCSTNHPIMIFNDQGVMEERKPRELNFEDVVITDSGLTYLSDIVIGQDNDETYIDITVEDTHTFFTTDDKESQMVLTHNSQGGLRGGSATMHFPLWHTDIESLMVLKNNKGTEETRERHLDYSIGVSGYFLERLVKGESITLLPPNLEGLYDSFYEDPKKFKELYEFYEKSEVVNVKMKKTISSGEIFRKLLTEGKNTGRVYLHFVDEMNRHTPFDRKFDPIHQSNLCVTGDTKILTDKGYEVISSLVDKDVNVWNGEEWSKTTVRQTSEASNIVTVTTDSGYELDCTLYHKFYIKEGRTVKKVEAQELKRGDKLIKFDLPVIEGNKHLEHAYDNGFFTGDGCYGRGRNKLFLYDKKQALVNQFTSVERWTSEPKYNRTVGYPKGIMEKFFVPDSSYTIDSRLKWLSGYIDADGYNHNNGLCVVSTNKPFLKELQLMLQTLGVSSKVKKYVESGKYELPTNNGTGEKSLYECKDGYRLLISTYDTYELLNLGLELKRVSINIREPNRDAKRHVKIEDVVNDGRVEPTYCFTEEKRNMGMFNGILTSQCQEIALPTRPFYSTDDENGRIALCTLANTNLGEFSSPQTMKHPLRRIVRALDNLLSMQDYPMIQAKLSTEEFRPLGIGVNNLAYFLAKNGVGYNDPKSLPLVHTWMEHMAYYMQEATIDLAKERGACKRSEYTKRSKGVMLVDTYKKRVDSIVDNKLELDWDKLREDAKEYGVRNATLSATMPSESNSQVMNCMSFDTVIRTNLGDLTFKEFAESQGLIYDEIIKSGGDMWFDVDEGVTVTNMNGEEEAVTGLYYNGETSVDEIILEDGSILHCTPKHRFLVERNGKKVWVFVSDLIEGDDIVEVKGG